VTSYVLLRRLIVNNERGPIICTLAIVFAARRIITISLVTDITFKSSQIGTLFLPPPEPSSQLIPSRKPSTNSQTILHIIAELCHSSSNGWSPIAGYSLKNWSRVWLTNTIQNTMHSLVNSYISMPGGQFTFPRQNEPRPGHGTQWVNSGTIPAIPGLND